MQSVIHLLVVTHPNPDALKELLPTIRKSYGPVFESQGQSLEELWPELVSNFSLGD